MITPHKLYANYKDRRFKPRKLYRNYSKLYVSFYWPNQANIYNKLNNKQLNKQFTIHQYTLRFMPHTLPLRTLAQHPRHFCPLARTHLHRPSYPPCRRHRHDRSHTPGLHRGITGRQAGRHIAFCPLFRPIKIVYEISFFIFSILVLFTIFVCRKMPIRHFNNPYTPSNKKGKL